MYFLKHYIHLIFLQNFYSLDEVRRQWRIKTSGHLCLENSRLILFIKIYKEASMLSLINLRVKQNLIFKSKFRQEQIRTF